MKPGDYVESKATAAIARVKRVVSLKDAVLIKYVTGRAKGCTHWVGADALTPRPDITSDPR